MLVYVCMLMYINMFVCITQKIRMTDSWWHGWMAGHLDILDTGCMHGQTDRRTDGQRGGHTRSNTHK